jgi:hypothetical protein
MTSVDSRATVSAAAPARGLGPGRSAAALAAASAVVHLLQVTTDSLGALVMAAMALACLPCARHLWRSPTRSTWGVTAALDAGMLTVHGQMLAVTHHHTATPSLMWLGLALVGGQLFLAGVAVLRR